MSLMFLPNFDVFCDLLLNKRTATWNLFVIYNKETKIVIGVIYASVLRLIIRGSIKKKNQSEYLNQEFNLLISPYYVKIIESLITIATKPYKFSKNASIGDKRQPEIGLCSQANR